MTAFSYTDWTVTCDYRSPGGDPCLRGERTDTLDMPDGSTAADVRKVLKRQGWAVAIPGTRRGPRGTRQRLDYCPAHKPPAGGEEG